ncbi:MAG: DUF4238 domain-containing protein [Blastocatellia bacterium]
MANDHYVPQFYLRNFSPTKAAGRVWCYKRKQRPSLKGIKSVASEEDFYTFTDKTTGQRNTDVEKFYDRSTESPAAPVIKKIMAMDHLILSDDERETIAHFAAHLITRNPRYRTIQKKYLDGDYEFLKYLENEESFLDGIQDLGITIEEAKERRKEILSNPDAFFEDMSQSQQELSVYGSLALGIDCFKALMEKQWQLIKSDSSRVFVTSDNPVSSIPPKNKPKNWESGFINQVLSLPLSPSKCLVFSRGEGFAKTIKVKREQVDKANFYTMFFAYTSVYSNLLSKDIENNFNSTPQVKDEEATFFKKKD